MTLRFTVSVHRVGEAFNRDGDHLDWFFQINDDPETPLTTFSTPIAVDLRSPNARAPNARTPNAIAPIGRTETRWAADLSTIEIPAVRLPDHRAAYLDYEGEVSGNRGHVRRLATGFFAWISTADDRWSLCLDSIEIFDNSLLGLHSLIHHPNHRVDLLIISQAP